MNQRPVPEDTPNLASLYMGSPAGRAHSVTLQLSAAVEGSRKGTLGFDPNTCTIDEWGDRRGCTKMAVRHLQVKTERLRTLDPSGHHRVLHRVHCREFEGEMATLVEFAAVGLWTLVYTVEGDGQWVIPLFPAKRIAVDPAGTIMMRYGAPMREVLERGDIEEMRREIATVRAALDSIADAPALRTSRSMRDEHVSDVEKALAELEAAVAELDS